MLLVHLVFQEIKPLNHFPVKGGTSDMIIPTTIMTGDSIHYNRHLDIHIGQYCQLNNEDTPCNRNKLRTKGAIYMGTSINMQGLKFISMRSMKKTTRQYWDMRLITDKFIDLVNILVKYQQ